MDKRFKYLIILIALVVLFFIQTNYKTLFYNELSPVSQSKHKVATVLDYINRYYVDSVSWKATTDEAIKGALQTLDPHSIYLSRKEVKQTEESFEGRYQGIGIQFDIVEGYPTVISVIPGSPSDRAGLQSGDKIIKIEGEPTHKISVDEVPRKLKGPKGTTVTVTILRSGLDKPFDVKLERDEIPITTINTYFMIDSITGYVWINRFAQTTDNELEDALQDMESRGMRRLIFDLRDNGGGLLRQAVKVVGKFINGNKLVVFTRGKLKAFNESFYTAELREGKVRDYPLILLINHGSASASEIVAGAIQDYDRGLLIGTTSFGKGLVQNEFELPDGSRIRLTVSKYYTPSGRLIQRPYKNISRQKYYTELWEDSSKYESSDSTNGSPVYYTSKGRKVYGGGGIKPDIIVEYINPLKSAQWIVQLLEKRAFFETVEKWAPDLGYWKMDFDMFYKRFQVSDAMLKTLKQIAQKHNITIPLKALREQKAFLKNRLKAELARHFWSMSEFYRVLLQNDNQFSAALSHFDEAEALLKMKKQEGKTQN